MTVSGEFYCVALHFYCVVVALPFSASLGVIVHVYMYVLVTCLSGLCAAINCMSCLSGLPFFPSHIVHVYNDAKGICILHDHCLCPRNTLYNKVSFSFHIHVHVHVYTFTCMYSTHVHICTGILGTKIIFHIHM